MQQHDIKPKFLTFGEYTNKFLFISTSLQFSKKIRTKQKKKYILFLTIENLFSEKFFLSNNCWYDLFGFFCIKCSMYLCVYDRMDGWDCNFLQLFLCDNLLYCFLITGCGCCFVCLFGLVPFGSVSIQFIWFGWVLIVILCACYCMFLQECVSVFSG